MFRVKVPGEKVICAGLEHPESGTDVRSFVIKKE
jgi:hypothetical protein